MDCLDTLCKIATVIIAAVNIIFAVFVFRKNRKRELTRALILDYSIKHFYQYFEDIDKELIQLKNRNTTQEGKRDIEKKLQSYGRSFEQKFIDLFLRIEPEMHKSIKNKIDDMNGKIVEAMFNEGINLYIEPQYNEKIATPVIVTKSELLKLLLESN